MSKDRYKDLKEATPEELLEAYIWQHICYTDVPAWWEDAVRAGFALANEGWGHVAPFWLKKYREDMKRNSEKDKKREPHQEDPQ